MSIKMTLKKRIFSVLLTVIMVFSMMPMSVFAANGAVAEVTTAGGATTSFLVYADAVGYASRNGGTLKLLDDITVPESETLDDIPFVTGEFTLDLNGKNINMVEVGSVALDEENEIIKGTPGTLTVTDSSSGGTIKYLTVNTGALTVAGGAIDYMYAENYAAAVNVTGGTVGQFSLSDGNDEEISATISGGVFRKIYMGGGTLTVNDDYQGKMDLDVNGGTTNIVGGTFADLRLAIRFGDIHLTGGTFTKISTDPGVSSSDYKNPTLASLLGDSCAFYGTDGGGIVNADVLTLENVKIVADHEHTYKDGKCTTCGALCKHDRVETAMGKCEVCGVQLEAEIRSEGSSPVYYTSFTEAWDALQPNRSDQVTITLLRPGYDLDETNLYVEAKNVRLDLNFHVMFGTGKIIVRGDHTTFTVENGDMNDITVEAADRAVVTVGEDCGSIKAVRVASTEAAVTIRSGIFEKLELPATDTESLKNVKLSGGDFTSISFNGTGTVAITDILEAGYAFRDNKGTLSGQTGALVPYGKNFDVNTYFADLEVVECSHSAVNDVMGYCNYCGKLYAAKITDKDGNVSYVEVLDWTLNLAENGTVKLLQDVADRCSVTRSMTFDLNGHHVDTLDLSVDGAVTVKGSGSIRHLCLGYNYNGVVKDTTLIIEKPTVGTVDVGFLAVKNSTKTKLDGWSFGQIARYDGLMLSDLLADGYAIFDKNSGKPVWFSGDNTGLKSNYYIDRHDHIFTANADGRDECECGLICDHTNINEKGICESCKTQIYFAVLTKADDTKQNYRSFTDAWEAAIENEGSTLKLLCNVEFDDNGADGLVLDHGKFTLDLGGFTLESFAYQQMLVIGGTADIVIKNGVLLNTYNTERGGLLFLTTGNVIDVKGGSLTLDGVTLHGAYEVKGTGEIQSYALELYSGNLTVKNCTFFGSLAVYKMSDESSPTVKITSATLHNGLLFTAMGKEKDYDGLSKLFADGSMLFDENGKYIDIRDDSYWITDGGEEYGYATGFYYKSEAVVEPHTHTYKNGICSECSYACPHNSGKNEREASYFEKAVCSVCHCEYGDYAKDTTAPTGKIIIKERTWWQSLLNTISFGLFYKEEVTVEITADDDSYTQTGYDKAKHAVKIEYLISTAPLSEETVKKGNFNEYTEPFDISDDDNYVIYAKLTDYAGNVAYAATEGFVVDTTAPVVEVYSYDDDRSERYANGQRVEICGDTKFEFIDDNFDAAYVTIDGKKESIYGNSYFADPDDSFSAYRIERWITFEVHDKAGNISTVEFYVHKEHSFNEEIGVCATCGYGASMIVKYVDKNNEEKFIWGDNFDELLNEAGRVNGAKSDQFYLKLYKNVEKRAGMITYGGENKWTYDLNGYTLSYPSGLDPDSREALFDSQGNITIVGEGNIDVYFLVSGGSLTVDGNCSFYKLEQQTGTVTINSGSFGSFAVTENTSSSSNTRTTELCGGHFGEIKIVDVAGLTCADLLGRGYRFEGLTFEQAKVTELRDVTVELCYHEHIDENYYCLDCGIQFVVAVRIGNVETLFDTFERAIRYAEQNEGCTVKLLRDLLLDTATVGDLRENTYGYVELTKGTYTLDLAGKTLTAGDWNNYYAAIKICDGCDLTFTDSVGGGKVVSEIDTVLDIRSGSHLTIESGDYSSFGSVMAEGPDSLTLKGGRFKQVCSREARNSVSPLRYLADGYAFVLTDSGAYAGENDVNSQVISGKGTAYLIDKVTVVSAPLIFHSQPRNKVYYLTTPNYEKWAAFSVEYSGGYPPKGDITVTGERTDGTVVYTNTVKPTRIFEDAINLWEFTTADSGQYRIKLEYNGYVLYSDTFTITMAVCEHPGYDENNKCTQCHCDLAAAIVKSGKTTGYVNFADALTAAQTDENKNCKLWMLTDVAGKIAVGAGDFFICMNGHTAGTLNVTKTAKLNIIDGTITGKVTVAKTASLSASVLSFLDTVNNIGNNGNFYNCVFEQTLNAKGSNTNFNKCTVNGALNVSGNGVILNDSSVSGKITVNNGALLQFMGNGCKCGEMLVKSGGALEVYSEDHTFSGKLMAEPDSTLTLSGGVYNEIAAQSGAKLTISGGKFTNITVNGQRLIDCLAEGKAFEDMNNGDVIDGRVGIAGNVKVVDHTHTCVWKTSTHEKLCGCGYVEAVDTEAPVISGIEDGKTYYGAVELSVTDANEFTVTVDGTAVQLTLGSYILEPDNEQHIITATDVAGNVSSVTVRVNKLYKVTLSSGSGYTLKGEPVAGYATDYTFTLEIADGYSKTDNFMVDVNGRPMQSDSGSYTVTNVTSDIIVTVFGVADITPPSAEIEIGTNKFGSFINKITFGMFFKKTQTVTVTASDEGSGIAKAEYLVSETAFADKNAITGDWTELTFKDGKASFDIEPNKKATVYVRVTDLSGNVQIINSDGVVVYTDSEAITQATEFTMLNNNDVNFNVNLNGNTVKALYNGEEQISDENHTASEDGTITLKNAYLKTLAAGEYTVRVAYNPMGEAYKSGDEPAMTAVKLTVKKAEPILGISGQNLKKDYDGKPIETPDYVTSSDGDVTVEYKPAGTDNSEYSTAVPKNAGIYEFRITVAETDIYNSAYTEGVYNIVPHKVTINGTAVEPSKIYDGTTDAEITNEGALSENFDGENLKIKVGKATYENRNAGVAKTVVFSDFAIEGSAAANYELTAQPANTVAEITAKELRIANLKVKNKQYDGTDTAEIEGIPTLVGLAGGDKLQLLNGTPTFSKVDVGEDIPINFTMFSLFGDSVTLTNYSLTQPTGVTANISEYIADGSEYRTDSNGWINTDFTVTANGGYKLSLANTADSEWTDKLAVSDETANGKLTFYVKNTANGAISAAITVDYKIDKTNPTGEIKLNKRSAFKDFINTITFGLFFNNDIEVELTANDTASGVKSVKYFKSDKALSRDEVRAVTDWTEDDSFGIKAKDKDRFIIYARIEDNAGNVNYISSDGATFDTAAPIIEGAEDGKTYYTTKQVTVKDANLDTVTLNGEKADATLSLNGDTNAKYVIRAVDKAGNATEYTVNMLPISSVTDAISAITADNVKSSDKETITGVENRLAAIEKDGATESENNKLRAAAENCKTLKDRIAAVAAEILRVTGSVNSYDTATVTSSDKSDIEKLVADIDTLLNGSNLTETERTALETVRATATALLDRISAAKSAAENSDIAATDDINKDNVKLEDKENLKKAENALEEALRGFDGNYTEEEQTELESKLETVKEALKAIDNVEKAAEEIAKLPKQDDAKLGDKDDVETVEKIIVGLTENEKAMLGADEIEKVNNLSERIAELEKISFNPSIIEGSGQKWNTKSSENARFRSNAEFDEFRKVLIDGNEIADSNYTVSEGSTVVELKADYLKTLSAGEHTLSIVSKNGTANTTFTVVKDTATTSPRTGDTNSLALWIALLFISGGVSGGILSLKKKKTAKYN